MRTRAGSKTRRDKARMARMAKVSLAPLDLPRSQGWKKKEWILSMRKWRSFACWHGVGEHRACKTCLPSDYRFHLFHPLIYVVDLKIPSILLPLSSLKLSSIHQEYGESFAIKILWSKLFLILWWDRVSMRAGFCGSTVQICAQIEIVGICMCLSKRYMRRLAMW